MPSNYEAITADNIRKRGEEFDDIGRFLAEQFYSDQTHFVYELLQNAQDALKRRALSDTNKNYPKSVYLSLYPDRLELRHFGQEFNEDDVKGISDILKGTKNEDTNQIGQFGIGFKSVYAFTESPEIHSGDEHFVIERYIRPRLIKTFDINPGETLFIFPFDHQEKKAKETFERIHNRIADLELSTILFLDEIEEIVWDISGKRSGAYIRDKHQTDDGAWRVTLLGEEGTKIIEESWLIFQQPVNGLDTNVEIAFKMNKDEKSGKEYIQPIDQSSLYAYFATEKETWLRFLIQGHYRTTPSRDNVLEDDEVNKNLIISTAKLLIRSLEKLKIMGLLDSDTLEAMPLKSEHFKPGSFFRPIFEEFCRAMLSLDLLPAFGGNYIKADEAKLARSSELMHLLPPDSLHALFSFSKNYQWLSDDITRDKTPDLREFLMKSLDIEEIDPERFARQISESFLESQSDSWLIKFYEFLDGQKALWRTKTSWDREGLLRKKPIIRISDNRMVVPFDELENPLVFLPTEIDTEFPTVKKSIVENKEAFKFLSNLGLYEPDLVDEILKFIIPKYEMQTPLITDELNTLDLKKISHAIEYASRVKKERLIKILRETSFLRAINPDKGIKEYKKPIEIYIDNDDLRCFFEGNPDIWFYDVFAGYENLSEDLGVSRSIKMLNHGEKKRYKTLKDLSGWHERGKDGFDPDWEIDGLAFTVNHININKAGFIWENLLRPNKHLIYGVVENSTKKDYSSLNSQKIESKVGEIVRHSKWLPDKSGEFHLPAELSLDDLPEGFYRDEELAQKLGMREVTVRAFALDHGVDEHALNLAIEWIKSDPDSFKNLASKTLEKTIVDSRSEGFSFVETLQETFEKPQEGFDESGENNYDTSPQPVQNPERRKEKIREEILIALLSESENNQQFRRIPSIVWEKKDNRVRSFLLNQYNGHCQICDKTFPKRNGVSYFEGLYLVSRILSQWVDRYGNVLCLCPTCCAKFQHGKVITEKVIDQILQYKMKKDGGSGFPGIIVELCGETVEIKFTESHMMDLQEIIKVSKEAVEEE